MPRRSVVHMIIETLPRKAAFLSTVASQESQVSQHTANSTHGDSPGWVLLLPPPRAPSLFFSLYIVAFSNVLYTPKNDGF